MRSASQKRLLPAVLIFPLGPAGRSGEGADPHALQAPAPSTAPQDANGNRLWSGYGYLETKDIPSPITPPWSSLTAYDLNKGSIKWKVLFGNSSEYESKGITGTGTIWPKSGVVVTAGGLIFAASRSDATLRAYDQQDGKIFWEMRMPAGSEGVPAVYEVKGREYFAVCATSPAVARPSPTSTPEGPRSYIVHALPENSAAPVKP